MDYAFTAAKYLYSTVYPGQHIENNQITNISNCVINVNNFEKKCLNRQINDIVRQMDETEIHQRMSKPINIPIGSLDPTIDDLDEDGFILIDDINQNEKTEDINSDSKLDNEDDFNPISLTSLIKALKLTQYGTDDEPLFLIDEVFSKLSIKNTEKFIYSMSPRCFSMLDYGGVGFLELFRRSQGKYEIDNEKLSISPRQNYNFSSNLELNFEEKNIEENEKLYINEYGLYYILLTTNGSFSEALRRRVFQEIIAVRRKEKASLLTPEPEYLVDNTLNKLCIFLILDDVHILSVNPGKDLYSKYKCVFWLYHEKAQQIKKELCELLSKRLINDDIYKCSIDYIKITLQGLNYKFS